VIKKRSEKVSFDAEQELRFRFEQDNVDLPDDDLLALFANCLNCAFKGKADLNDLFVMAGFVVTAFKIHDDLYKNLPHIARSRSSFEALLMHNEKRKRPDTMIMDVKRANDELMEKLPVDARRFREIADKLNLTIHQVRHILKPSKRKPKR